MLCGPVDGKTPWLLWPRIAAYWSASKNSSLTAPGALRLPFQYRKLPFGATAPASGVPNTLLYAPAFIWTHSVRVEVGQGLLPRRPVALQQRRWVVGPRQDQRHVDRA